MAGIRATHVPYKGLGPAVADLVAGHTQVMISNAPPAMPFVKSGKLRALAVTSERRLAAMPALPTVAESGIRGYEADVWYGLYAPAGTPTPIVDLLHQVFAQVLRTPDLARMFADMGAIPMEGSPSRFSEMISADIAKWGKVVRASGASKSE